MSNANAQLRPVEPVKLTQLETILKRANIPYLRGLVGKDPLVDKEFSRFAKELIYQFTDMPAKIYVDVKSIVGSQVLWVGGPIHFPEDVAFNSVGVRSYVYRESGLFDSAAVRLKEMYGLTLDMSREKSSYHFSKFIDAGMTEDEILSAIQSVRTAHLALKEVQEKEKQRIDERLTSVLHRLEAAKRQQG